MGCFDTKAARQEEENNVSILKVRKEQVEKLKKMANETSINAYKMECRPYSTYEVIAAHIWKSSCRMLQRRNSCVDQVYDGSDKNRCKNTCGSHKYDICLSFHACDKLSPCKIFMRTLQPMSVVQIVCNIHGKVKPHLPINYTGNAIHRILTPTCSCMDILLNPFELCHTED